MSDQLKKLKDIRESVKDEELKKTLDLKIKALENKETILKK